MRAGKPSVPGNCQRWQTPQRQSRVLELRNLGTDDSQCNINIPLTKILLDQLSRNSLLLIILAGQALQ